LIVGDDASGSFEKNVHTFVARVIAPLFRMVETSALVERRFS
jgi:hypothetical protein